jgi:hypothetical protein
MNTLKGKMPRKRRTTQGTTFFELKEEMTLDLMSDEELRILSDGSDEIYEKLLALRASTLASTRV